MAASEGGCRTAVGREYVASSIATSVVSRYSFYYYCALVVFFISPGTKLNGWGPNAVSATINNQTHSAPIGGPNVCGQRGRSYCCPGWQMKISTGLCIIPVCPRRCGRGRCVKPNKCLCENGVLASSCLPTPHTTRSPNINYVESTFRKPDFRSKHDDASCRYPCLNGGKCQNGKCVCKQGYQGENCMEAICKEPCLNGGRCIAPDTCACVYGYTGKRCEADYRTGPCYTKVENGMCQAQLPGVVCTRNLCCATVGKAWGHPCEMCPTNLPCDDGFLKNIHSGECVDINECEAIPGLCRGGQCLNTVGSFKCECPTGQARDTDTNICRDVNECEVQPNVCENGHCVNTDGSFYCMCRPGFITNRDSTGCIDARQEYCYTAVSRNKECLNHLQIRLSKRDCCCGMNMGKAWGHNCDACPLPTDENYKFLCGGSKDGPLPVTVDECGLRPDICGGGQCVDTPDGYTCNCFPGFVKGQTQVCEDIDECKQGLCMGGTCYNYPGRFECTCPPGFDVSSDGKRCIDHDECAQTGMCYNGICINMDGSFKCQCKSGFVLSATGHACHDTDECLENPRICLNGRCENTPGSYRCICQAGYTLSDDGAFCLDTDECSKTGMCNNGRCVNTEGSYKCLCDTGYKLADDKKYCIDIDECQSHNAPCQNGICYNTPGSFNCVCKLGFHLGPDGRSCIDTRKEFCYSVVKDGQCSGPSITAVTKSACCCCISFPNQPMAWGLSCQVCPQPGTTDFNSLCPHGPGMTSAGTDINECAQNPNICTNGACENLIGSHRCICNPGFEVDGSGKVCNDIDECKMDDNICHGGQCRNTPGSFQCICPSGTQLNVITYACEDVDECRELGSDACFSGRCYNTFGSYTCECDAGTILDHTGRMCIDNRKGSCWTRLVGGRCEASLPQLTLKSECCCSVGLAWGSPCEPCQPADCGCPKGFAKKDGKICKDINECELNAGVCRGGGTCVNTEGSFTCICMPGLTLDATGTMCIDTRQESCFTELKHGQGVGPVEGLYPKTLCCCSALGKAWGGPSSGDKCEACPKTGSPTFSDLCPKGMGFLDKKDINECLEFPDMCSNGRCKNSMGGFNCRCNQGFTLDDNEIKCVDIDECSIMHGVCGNGTCQNVPGSFNCDCKEGYESTMMMKVCMDIDECERSPGLCKGGTCRNTPGSFKCDCPPGHELSPDKLYCKDIDECSRTSGICSNGVCENMMGTYQCVCDDGYKHGDITSHCEDIDECEEQNGDCDSLCLNSPGSYACACHEGFLLKKDGRACHDIDECSENPRICNGGKCTNSIGSFKCDCTKGLLPGPDGSSCVDINECTDHPNICGNGECDNTIGSFKCHCEVGYSAKPYEGPHCTDDDECELMMHNCDLNADCINNPGSFSCRCTDGFVGDGVTCRDINECLTNNGGCNQHAQCKNTEGSFECVCDAGFRGDGFNCVDIDECTENPMYCQNGHCLNQPGNYRCECEMGFMHPDNSDTSCVDINECKVFNNVCVFGRCENVFGLFKCICDEGYQLDHTGGNCTDINECENPGACRFGTCKNTVGSYVCQCPPNYQLVPTKDACVDKRESRCYQLVTESFGRPSCSKETGHPVTKATCCCSVGQGWGSRCEVCPKRGSKEYEELCPGGSGYRPNDVTVEIEDINECEDHENICKNGHCTNTFGSFMCSCKDGFRLNEEKAICEDIDECFQFPNICGVGFCMNEQGTYHCICPDGYMSRPNGKECIDMRKDLCYMEFIDDQCGHPMSNPQTRMLCCCSMGEAWGEPCKPCPTPRSKDYIDLCGHVPGQIMNPMTNQTEEIDECKLMPTMCNRGRCMNTPGSFECECERGFSYDIDAHQCIDENECLRSPSPCRGNAQCVNTQGSFECQCPEGYRLGVSMRDCIDIDECEERPGVCSPGSCNNFQGSFQCTCHSGYALTPTRSSCIDINECVRHPNICNNGSCSNFMGTFKCQCNEGFKLSPNNDCIDIDECQTMPFLCRNGRCKNTVGSFKCECAQGYLLSPDGQQCRDINECSESPGICPYPGKCQNMMGSFLCSCPPGYRLSADKRQCSDVNECAERRGICDGGQCINVDGAFICECPDGFVLSESKQKCVDTRQDLCYEKFKNGRCHDSRMEPITMKECCCSMGEAWGISCDRCPIEGTEEFLKLCPQGIGRYDSGADLNECLFMPNACTGGDCINTDGSYRCSCPPGYVLDSTNKKCVDDNECVSTPNICGNGTCRNVEGSFECDCSLGFAAGPMQICEDINECQEMSNQCAFRCHNVPGSFRCICPYGYTLAPDGRHCQDVDECLTPANNCKFQCKNLIGSFMCICPEGYSKVDMTDDCKDIDECRTLPGICENGRCRNLDGSFECDCFPGYKPNYDFTKCMDERQGLCFRQLSNGKCAMHSDNKNSVTKADCCCTMGAAWGPGCEKCPTPGTLAFADLCLESGISIDGKDIDECKTLPDLCKHGTCINTLGSYKCMCNRGYKVDHSGTVCRDVNECDNKPSPCEHSCQNTPGSYLCSCPKGLQLGSDGESCVDIDECETGLHICQQTCINTVGSYQCSCLKGYRQEGDYCLDIDECKIEEGLCPIPGKCINTLGSFRCLCPRGYRIDDSGKFCRDSDECTDDSKCEHGCQNIMGSYKCGCPDGFLKHAYYNHCVDENECDQNPCGQTKCFNTVGSYKCGCAEGFQYDNALSICVQISPACAGSPCSFGCAPSPQGGFLCGCPQGYQHVGQGHCFSTLTVGGGHQNTAQFPTLQDPYRISTDKIISTEGCFSCKVNEPPNGRQRRMTNSTAQAKRKALKGPGRHRHWNTNGMRHKRHYHFAKNEISNETSYNMVWIHEARTVKVRLMQTKHRTRIIKLLPASKNDFDYLITKGNERNQFELIKKHGVWGLHFRKRLKVPETFHLSITAQPRYSHFKPSIDQPLILHVKLIVVT